MIVSQGLGFSVLFFGEGRPNAVEHKSQVSSVFLVVEPSKIIFLI